jgi:transcriptional regulator with XRE-family HTH domain
MDKEHENQLGQFLQARREACRLSQRGLAKAAHVHQTTVVRLEAGAIGAPHLDKLSRIAAVLGVRGTDLLALAGYTPPTDLPSLRPYLETRYGGFLAEDIEKIEAYVGRVATRRGFALLDATPAGVPAADH